MNNNALKFGLVVAFLIAVALLAAVWAIVALQVSPFQVRTGPAGGFVPGDFEFFYVATTILSTINIALLVVLLVTYVSIYSKTRASFSLGLVIFAAAFLTKDLAASPLVAGLFSFRAFGLGPFELLPGVFECAALLVLLYLSIRY
jgi:hypothetical protein